MPTQLAPADTIDGLRPIIRELLATHLRFDGDRPEPLRAALRESFDGTGLPDGTTPDTYRITIQSAYWLTRYADTVATRGLPEPANGLQRHPAVLAELQLLELLEFAAPDACEQLAAAAARDRLAASQYADES